jgi:hypothetical protein
MTLENQSLVRDSFAKVVPIAPQAAAMFYDRCSCLIPMGAHALLERPPGGRER